ncbi:uncharacterized protein K460DRAFT_402144 [Cucurbitaria berberidis CBS 394.84]|uniref:Fibroin-3 related protein n=1 Tax=Cucurbitaria berberidis CBS 394.84 TaxID=1168544 RepID=A0A9P4LF86_9PLEO|nr:uncharacterized protein K460DRAFT_402144 [Cucurbitaria berberidis CBS 394.84]KAF1852157.1 hypothetical protein K460DRAFT_402144 [Cucurbitaria berberidis CBS 394.84]
MPALFARQNPLDEARKTLSSWDNCMAKSYCKWPVIVVIVVGSLILLSIVISIARCICCGAECVCCCFKCCSCCCGGGRSGHKRVKSEPTPIYPPTGAANPYAAAHAVAPPAPPIDSRAANQQYQSNAMPAFTPTPAAAPAAERPQFATFASADKPVNEDALPAMPTWKDGRDVHVAVEEKAVPEKQGDMEMDRLNHNGSVTNGSTTGVAAMGGARRSPSGRTPLQRTPTGDSYGFPPSYQSESFVGAGPRNSPGPYGSQNARPYAQQDDYRRGSPGPNSNLSPIYGPGEGYSQVQQFGRRSPGQPQAYNQYNGHDRYDPHDQYNEPDRRFRSPPPNANNYNYGFNNPSPYEDFAPAPAQQRSHTPGYAPSESTRYEPSTAPTYTSQAPVQQRSHTPGYPQPDSTRFEPSTTPVYPGQATPQQRSHTPGYAPSDSTGYEPSAAPTYTSQAPVQQRSHTPGYEPSAAPAYTGQQSYSPQGGYPGQQSYQPFQPGAPQGQQQPGMRRAYDGSNKEYQ